MKLQPLRSLLVMALFAAVPAALFGQPARILFSVSDASGEPLPGVAVTLTTEERGSVSIEGQTDKRGRASVIVPSVAMLYDAALQKDGYQPLVTSIRPKLGETAVYELTMVSAEAAATSAGPGAERVFTPAERAFNAGVEAMTRGELDAALEKFLEAQGKDPKFHAVHSALAAIYLEQGKPADALASAQRFLEAEPQSPRGLRLLYQAHHDLANHAEAAAALKALAALEKGGDVAPLLFNEGADALKVGDLETAEKRFVDALEAQPDLAPALHALMILQVRREDWQQAAQRAEQLLALEPQNALALRARWDAYRNLGEAERAEAAFEALAEVDRTALADSLLEAGIATFNAGDAQGAIADLARAAEIDPDRAIAHYYLGLCYTNTGQPALARTHLQRFVELAPDDPNAASAREMLKYLE